MEIIQKNEFLKRSVKKNSRNSYFIWIELIIIFLRLKGLRQI